ncbi:hypothetical protein RRF57_000344 [Xylaria bambusicola]|uniref:Major facilitator superfamily (MFS) profile domain-containing protein n=1 Tax=Xylaria bambusicola TaxID=326684 RepID=A0AAN7U9Z8_9PEZI
MMSATLEKPDVIEIDQAGDRTQKDVIGHIDAMATAPGVTCESFAHLDEKKILRKVSNAWIMRGEFRPSWSFSGIVTHFLQQMDIRLIPMLALLYLLSFLDLSLPASFIFFKLFSDPIVLPPSQNIGQFLTLFERLRPSRWLPSIMVAWGFVLTLMGIVQNFQGLLSTRLFLGVTEAGLYPGCATQKTNKNVKYYLTMWYCRKELQLRQAMFFSAASVAGAFSGLLAFAIAKLDGLGGLEGWRWIFILEGLTTVVVAVAAFFLLYDFPETATFLTEEERAFVIFRLKYQGHTEEKEEGNVRVSEAEDFDWKYHLKTGLLTVPIYVTASILAVVVAYFSDRVGKRSPFVVGCLIVILVGYILCISTGTPGVVYAGVFIAAAGIYPAFAGNITWLSNNLAGIYKRGAGMAIQIGAGNLGGAFASNFYRQRDSPRYILGHALELAFTSAGLIAAAILIVNYMRINKKRAKTTREGGHNEFTPEGLSAQGDRAVTFRYVY